MKSIKVVTVIASLVQPVLAPTTSLILSAGTVFPFLLPMLPSAIREMKAFSDPSNAGSGVRHAPLRTVVPGEDPAGGVTGEFLDKLSGIQAKIEGKGGSEDDAESGDIASSKHLSAAEELKEALKRNGNTASAVSSVRPGEAGEAGGKPAESAKPKKSNALTQGQDGDTPATDAAAQHGRIANPSASGSQSSKPSLESAFEKYFQDVKSALGASVSGSEGPPSKEAQHFLESNILNPPKGKKLQLFANLEERLLGDLQRASKPNNLMTNDDVFSLPYGMSKLKAIAVDNGGFDDHNPDATSTSDQQAKEWLYMQRKKAMSNEPALLISYKSDSILGTDITNTAQFTCWKTGETSPARPNGHPMIRFDQNLHRIVVSLTDIEGKKVLWRSKYNLHGDNVLRPNAPSIGGSRQDFWTFCTPPFGSKRSMNGGRGKYLKHSKLYFIV